ncbi:TPA: GNAT family N-acetyltransferase [Xanthomonas vasicola pv. zeae]|uniref:Protein ElaA n=3 Tax=Xanthomonas vasicola TaxID=56459 RepID=A0A836ZTX2_XANVA|nr:GNAT family N-acetyltransferase [Xanthomonas vasicola]KFA39722.1 drug:proton antiporter [Xanthomonas vasicola pv. musacearum NCPPB 4384]AVQ05820.1 GNAT family N-acetyltransferase [Xanthomonas vasicola pv. vasculorum]AZM70019.1 GNAT family N-acetyltransferase [Xanthomonas vasicola pv. vasculorum]AZR21613.1 GNAT family N-acetyltransferase [Xanthomonas vasicola]AZR28051.1 GNAT family N-acetyltransferase [Xanthomonas vasicola pv. arecae]
MLNTAIPSLHWQHLRFAQLSTTQLYALLRLRTDVFVVEQQCAYPELDGKDTDPAVLHVLGNADNGELAAYLRVLPPGLSYSEPSIGRVVIAAAHRGTGLAHALLREGIRLVQTQWPGSAIQLGAQAHLQAFYAAHGFAPASEQYLEDDIPHLDMLRPAGAALLEFA